MAGDSESKSSDTTLQQDSSTSTGTASKSTSSKTNENPTAPVSSFNIPFDKLMGEENWPDWRMLMELYLGDLFACTLKDPEAAVLADRNCQAFKDDLMARQKISFGVDKSLLKYLRGASTAHQTWSKLCNAFEDKGVFRLAALLRKLVSLKQESTLAQYVLEFKEVVGQIADTGKAIEDEMCSVLLLANVKPIHKSFCQIVERTCQTKLPDGTSTLEFNVISEELLREGNKIKSEETPKTQTANKAVLKSLSAQPGKSQGGTWQHGHRGGGRGSSKPPSGGRSLQQYNSKQNPSNQKSADFQPRKSHNKYTKVYPKCIHCAKTNHPEKYCHFRYSSAASQAAAAAEAAARRKRKHQSESDEEDSRKKIESEDPKGPPKWVLKIARRGKANTASTSSATNASESESDIATADVVNQLTPL
ncbi:Retrovirus-related Pol polyprotein from transposon TNT 1-94 [Frankliniella fusca]|uniref:Retrovirus-related Pol polyprotein from transposon TNT 1-94 n=1 Tax=Frankliniella fusca TaxID=407009 RepID=A0AAE1HJ03_9NEOP|nr:Retrovirus-related Pol polyprotein from transposon TNT 1-94 [Frankliniella fusca]KAK3921465.1 Retrovirus-related Pol polyprotein from transposon TNT 1-94 [Frankliniella fusca]